MSKKYQDVWTLVHLEMSSAPNILPIDLAYDSLSRNVINLIARIPDKIIRSNGRIFQATLVLHKNAGWSRAAIDRRFQEGQNFRSEGRRVSLSVYLSREGKSMSRRSEKWLRGTLSLLCYIGCTFH